jgi:hypothetical protein
METIGGVQGFVDIKVVDKKTGEVKQHIKEYNTLTLGALVSIFARGMFEKPYCFHSELPMADAMYDNRADTSWKPYNPPKLFRYFNGTSWADVSYYPMLRDSRGSNNGLAGIRSSDDKYALYSAFAPNSFGVYFLRNSIAIDKHTQIPPYARDLCSVLSSDVAGYSQGVVLEEIGSVEDAQQMYGSSEGSFFNPAHLIHARQLVRHTGAFNIRSVVWGAAVDDPCCWGVRARIKGFDDAGYSHFYAIEHRKVGEEPQTILWQDDRTAGWFNNTNVTRDIRGFNITTGKIEDKIISLTQQPSHWMGAFMQSVVIGNSAFTVSQSGMSITVNRYGSWKDGNNTLSGTLTIPLSPIETGTAVNENRPVALHNLETGYLEIFTTVARLQNRYEIRRVVLNPATFAVEEETSHLLPYRITQTLPSVAGTQASLEVTNSSDRTRASTFIGFLDYTSRTDTTDGVYHLPISSFFNNNGVEITVGSTFPETWMYGYRVGVRFTIHKETGNTMVGSPFIVCGIYSFTVDPVQGLTNTGSPGQHFMARYCYEDSRYGHNYRTCSHDRILQWGYTKTNFQNTVLPVQMMPVTGPLATTNASYLYANTKNPFSLMLVSRVMCGLNLNQEAYKSESDSLYVTYGWQLKVSDT